MGLMFKLILFVLMAATCLVFVEARLETDVQTEIRLIKQEIVDIKRMEDLTQLTMKAFDSRVNSVDSRVTDLSKETSQLASSVQKFSDREEQHHEKVREKVEMIERKSTLVSEKVLDLSIKETKSREEIQQLGQQSRATSERMKALAGKEELMKLKNHTKEIQIQTDKKVEEVTIQTDKKVQEVKVHTDRKVEEVNIKTDQKIQEVKNQTAEKFHTLTQTMETLASQFQEFKERGMVDALHPIGSIYITFTNVEPPKNGQYGVKWEKLPEGYVLMSADDKNVGTVCGSQRADRGYTEGHRLTVAQMPQHTHQYERYDHKTSGSNRWGHDISVADGFHGGHITSSTGGGEAHSHKFDFQNQKILVWKRSA